MQYENIPIIGPTLVFFLIRTGSNAKSIYSALIVAYSSLLEPVGKGGH